MRLQQLMIQKIDEFGGIERLTNDMQKLREFTNEKKYYDNMIIFFNNLFTQTIDAESFTIKYHQSSLDTIEFLEAFNETRNDCTNQFLIDLINYKSEFVSGIRKIS
jgi:hypothetical protein